MAKKPKSKTKKGEKKPLAKKEPFLKKYWREKSSILKFLFGFAFLVILFYILYYSIIFQDYIKDPILKFQTTAGAALLNVFGQPVAALGDVLAGDEVSVKIAGGCDGLEALALLLAAIFVFPLPFKYKWPGLFASIVVLGILNIIRIAGLYLVRLYWPEGFDFMHIQGGLYLFSIVTILLMLIWANWALNGYKKELALNKQLKQR